MWKRVNNTTVILCVYGLGYFVWNSHKALDVISRGTGIRFYPSSGSTDIFPQLYAEVQFICEVLNAYSLLHYRLWPHQVSWIRVQKLRRTWPCCVRDFELRRATGNKQSPSPETWWRVTNVHIATFVTIVMAFCLNVGFEACGGIGCVHWQPSCCYQVLVFLTSCSALCPRVWARIPLDGLWWNLVLEVFGNLYREICSIFCELIGSIIYK